VDLDTAYEQAMTSDQRIQEIARVLAAGVLRLRARVALPSAVALPAVPADSVGIRLELP
jgi:hypothetical protein